MVVDGSGSAYLTGTSRVQNSDSDYLTIKYDNAGNDQWAALYEGPTTADESGTSLALDGSGNLYVAGYSRVFTTIKYSQPSTPWPTFTPTPAPPTPTPWPGPGHTITVGVAEFPGCYYPGPPAPGTVVLQPLGWQNEVWGGANVFHNVPDGDYTLTVPMGCNPFGCWNPMPVTVAGNDVSVTICMEGAATATPTPTPTPLPPAAVGGIAEAPDVDASPLDTARSSSPPHAALAGAGAAIVIVLGAGGWYARRRYSVSRR